MVCAIMEVGGLWWLKGTRLEEISGTSETKGADFILQLLGIHCFRGHLPQVILFDLFWLLGWIQHTTVYPTQDLRWCFLSQSLNSQKLSWLHACALFVLSSNTSTVTLHHPPCVWHNPVLVESDLSTLIFNCWLYFALSFTWATQCSPLILVPEILLIDMQSPSEHIP